MDVTRQNISMQIQGGMPGNISQNPLSSNNQPSNGTKPVVIIGSQVPSKPQFLLPQSKPKDKDKPSE